MPERADGGHGGTGCEIPMKTRMMTKEEFLGGQAEQAAALLAQGEVVAFPTETVYGLGALALDASAVEKIFLAKGRPQDNPLIVHVSAAAQAKKLAAAWTPAAEKLTQAFWPGPLTIIVKAAPCIPRTVTAGLDTVGLRMPEDEIAQALIRSAGPIAAPSANVSGRPSPVTAMHVYQDLQERIPLIIDGGPCRVGVESTVVDVTGDVPVILRPGHVTREQIEALWGACEVAGGVLAPVTGRAASPGMLHKHYAPRGRTVLASYGPAMIQVAREHYDEAEQNGQRAVIIGRHANQAAYGARRFYPLDIGGPMTKGLFAALRRADDEGMQFVVLEGAPLEGEELAYMNRALRAAGFCCVGPKEK